jgi:hypothetical protein
VYLRLNGINLDVEATPAPCTSGSEIVCPVKAGALNQYSAIVSFSSDLPPVGQLHVPIENVAIPRCACQHERERDYALADSLLHEDFVARFTGLVLRPEF